MFSRMVFAVAVLAPSLAAAAPCDSIWRRPLPEGEVLLARVSPLADNPGKRHVFEVMRRGIWNIVWAEFDDAEPGAFFIEQRGGRLIRAETWGGVAPREEAKEVEEWALKQGANFPRALAACFGWYVTEGREGPTARANPFKGQP